MSVYKIFPEKDASILSDLPYTNTGLSEVLDLSNGSSDIFFNTPKANRALIKFTNEDINDVINNYIGTSSFSASLKLYLADASAIPSTFSLNLFPVSGSWDMGTGRLDDVPTITNGVSWLNRKPSDIWSTSSYSPGVTASFFTSSKGGGTWYTSPFSTQSFSDRANLDLNFDVTSIISSYLSGSIINEGFIIKNDSSIEFDTNYEYKLTYFSVDTNTIYPPCLELKWDDSVYNPNTSSMSMISNDYIITIGNNKGEYSPGDIVRFNINARDRYPQRTFVTSSLYTVNKYLPTSSYYSIVDDHSGNVIIDFDNQFTKISTDSNGSYFKLYMNGLEPRRYYKLIIRVEIDGSSIDIYDTYFFKISG